MMNKREYIRQLRRELKNRKVNSIGDIITDYEDLIEIKIREGLTEEEAVESLGPVEDLANAYGEKQKVTGDSNILIFAVLQVFNIMFGLGVLAVVFSVAFVAAVMFVCALVVIAITIVNLITGGLTGLIVIMFALGIISAMLFIMAFSYIVAKTTIILVYDYIILNVNLIKTKKVPYKRLLFKKYLIIFTVVSFIVSSAFSIFGGVVSVYKGTSYINEVMIKLSYVDERKETEYEISDDITAIDVDGMNVIFEKGSENKVVTNHKVDYFEDDGKLYITDTDQSVLKNFGLTFLDEPKTIRVITNIELEEVTVNSVNFEFTDIKTNYLEANAVNVNVVSEELEDASIIIDSTNTSLTVEESVIRKISINSVNADVEIDESEVRDIEIDSTNTELLLIDSVVEFLKFDGFNSELILERSVINKFDNNTNVKDLDADSNSEIKEEE